MLTISEDAIATTYADTELLIKKTVHEFIARHGGSFDDLIEHAGECFVKAYRSYNHRTKFSYWLRWLVWKHLQELYRKRGRQKTKFIELDPDVWLAPVPFNRSAFLEELSEDARLVVGVVLDTPWGCQPPNVIRDVLRCYLRQPAMGWSGTRVRQTFREVALALGRLPEL